ncbi:MAG TPA: HEAT repeat domain-containing protein, partial [Planctomycetota bacterium]|nr:HEAT repeat domain-containing protein [Planctomycetota bacterium]
SKEGEARDAARKKLVAAGDETLPHLVRALDDADEKVRRAAVELLREIAKQDFGYRPEAELKDNAEAIRKWQEWLKGRLKTEG